MRTFLTTLLITGTLTSALLGLSGCIQMPTETQGTVDDRPTLSVIAPEEVKGTLYLDGLEIGALDDLRAPKHAVRVLPGKHQVEIRDQQGKVLLQQTLFLAPSSHKSLPLN